MGNWKTYLIEKKIDTIKNDKIVIDLKDIDLHGTIHSAERQTRKDNQGAEITETEIKRDILKAIPEIVNDFANGEIEKNAEIRIYNKKTNLNIIIAIDMKKGKDFIKVITVMRKSNFKEKPGTYKYEI